VLILSYAFFIPRIFCRVSASNILLASSAAFRPTFSQNQATPIQSSVTFLNPVALLLFDVIIR